MIYTFRYSNYLFIKDQMSISFLHLFLPFCLSFLTLMKQKYLSWNQIPVRKICHAYQFSSEICKMWSLFSFSGHFLLAYSHICESPFCVKSIWSENNSLASHIIRQTSLSKRWPLSLSLLEECLVGALNPVQNNSLCFSGIDNTALKWLCKYHYSF